jgi:hypothetical protein
MQCKSNLEPTWRSRSQLLSRSWDKSKELNYKLRRIKLSRSFSKRFNHLMTSFKI